MRACVTQSATGRCAPRLPTKRAAALAHGAAGERWRV